MKQSENPIPQAFIVDISPELYRETKKHYLKQIDPMIRPHVSNFLRHLTKIKPADIVDAIDEGETAETIADKLRPFSPPRIVLRVARAFIKSHPEERQQADDAINLELVKLILRKENPEGWFVIKRYGVEGIEWLDEFIKSFKRLLHITPPPEKPKKEKKKQK